MFGFNISLFWMAVKWWFTSAGELAKEKKELGFSIVATITFASLAYGSIQADLKERDTAAAKIAAQLKQVEDERWSSHLKLAEGRWDLVTRKLSSLDRKAVDGREISVKLDKILNAVDGEKTKEKK